MHYFFYANSHESFVTGYYRVNYDHENWKLLIKQLHKKHHDIHALNRAQLIDDSFTLAIDKKVSYVVPFSLMTYLRTETDVIPWIPAMAKMTTIFAKHRGSAIETLLQVPVPTYSPSKPSY